MPPCLHISSQRRPLPVIRNVSSLTFPFYSFPPLNIQDSSKSGLDLPKDGVLLQKSVWLKYKAHTCGRICVPCSEFSRVSLRSMAFSGRSYFRTILVDRPNGLVLIGYRLRPVNYINVKRAKQINANFAHQPDM